MLLVEFDRALSTVRNVASCWITVLQSKFRSTIGDPEAFSEDSLVGRHICSACFAMYLSITGILYFLTDVFEHIGLGIDFQLTSTQTLLPERCLTSSRLDLMFLQSVLLNLLFFIWLLGISGDKIEIDPTTANGHLKRNSLSFRKPKATMFNIDDVAACTLQEGKTSGGKCQTSFSRLGSRSAVCSLVYW